MRKTANQSRCQFIKKHLHIIGGVKRRERIIFHRPRQIQEPYQHF